jgi:thiol-disulfide isomerase/thioredoxin
MTQRRLQAIFLVLILVLSRAGLAEETDASPPPGEPLSRGTFAPDFTLRDVSGNLVDISSHLGKIPVVLGFWSIHCDSCPDEMLALQKLENKYQGESLIILAVNEDTRVPAGRIGRFLERLQKFRGKISYPILIDQESTVFNEFRIRSLPTLVLIDGNGRIAGYFEGFDPEGERDFLSTVEKTVPDAGTLGEALTVPADGGEILTASGEAALCGFYESGTWRKGFTGNESFSQEMDLTRDVARRDASRNAVISALKMLNIVLYSNEPRRECLDGSGIHLARNPFVTRDPLSNLMGRITYSDFFEIVTERERLIDTTFISTMKVRVHLDRLGRELESLGYQRDPIAVTFTYVNVSPVDRQVFLRFLLEQSMYVGNVRDPSLTPNTPSQVFEVYTSSQAFADEIREMDFGEMQVFVEDVTDTSLDLEVWHRPLLNPESGSQKSGGG